MPYKNPADQREAWRRYYERRKATNPLPNSKPAGRERNRAIVREAKAVPCTDCGMEYPHWVMDFDHLGDKEAGIAHMANQPVSEARLRAEIAKCEVVCANCHRERTHQRRHGGSGYWRAQLS